MKATCPCGSPATVGHGSKARSYLRVSGRTVEKATCETPRFLCRMCGKTFGVMPAHAVEDERQARDLVAGMAFAHGRSGAVRASGLGEGAVDGLIDRWQAEREDDVAEIAPDFVLLDQVAMRDGAVVLVADVDRETLVAAEPGLAGLARWLGRPDVLQPISACVPVDAALAGAVRASVPGIRLMVSPSGLARAIRTAMAAGLASLRRNPGMGRRNAFPGSARFLRALGGRIAPGEGWPLEVLALLTAGRAARAIADAPDGDAGAKLWPEFEVAAAVLGGAPLRRLMGTWREAILVGLDHRFVDGMSMALTKVRRAALARRPTLLARDFRAFVLLRDAERAPSPPGRAGLDVRTLAIGRPMAGLADLIARRR